MMKLHKPLAMAALVMTIGLNAGAAQAFTPFATLNFNGGTTANFSHNNIGNTSFADYFAFTLPSSTSGSGGTSNLGAGTNFFISSFSFVPNVTFTDFSLYSVDGSGSLTLVSTTGGLYSSTWSGITYPDTQGTIYFSGLSQGAEYALYVAGSGSQSNSSYSGTVTLSPVPEPRSYAMLLAGLGLIGATAFRRRKSSSAEFS